MRGQIIAVLGLFLSLVSGAQLPGEDQEVTTNQTADLLNERSTATTSPFFVTSGDLHDFSESSNLSKSLATTSGSLVNDRKTERPASEELSTVDVLESGTVAPEEVVTESGWATSSPSRTFPVPDTREVTSANPTPTSHPVATTVEEEVKTETRDRFTESPTLVTLLRIPPAQTEPSNESPVDATEHTTTTTAFYTTWMSAITTSLFITTTVTTTDPTSPATRSTMTSHTSRPEVHRGPSVLEVGDDQVPPSYHSRNSSNPLFVMIVSIFTIMVVMVVVVVGFHRYKKRNSRTEFRRLQDLPMDDMMEDTPLSLYSY